MQDNCFYLPPNSVRPESNTTNLLDCDQNKTVHEAESTNTVEPYLRCGHNVQGKHQSRRDRKK